MDGKLWMRYVSVFDTHENKYVSQTNQLIIELEMLEQADGDKAFCKKLKELTQGDLHMEIKYQKE